MEQPTLTLLAAAIAFSTAAHAEVPAVATDIAPVHSLVAQVMGDLGQPDLILPPGASPHGYSLRPSEARALARADVVFWIGEDLEPWMAGPLATLAGGARQVELLDVPGTTVLEFRKRATFSESDNGHDHEEETQADQADRADHEDGEHVSAPDAEHDDHGHVHEGRDPHAWLDPENASVWVAVIADVLSEADPENAATYAANAAATEARLGALTAEVSARLEPVRGVPYVVFHDAYQYFGNRFDVPAVGAISLSDATEPGAARVALLRDLVHELGIECIATEPQFNPALVKALAPGGEVRTTVLDPLGATLEPGPGYYDALISDLADQLLACK